MSPYLVLKFTDGGNVGIVLSGHRQGLTVKILVDLELQLSIGLLQQAHLLEVGGQTIVQVLHCQLLISRKIDGIGEVKAASDG